MLCFELTHNKCYRKWYRCLIKSVTKGVYMTRGSIREYIEAIKVRYLKANKKEKGVILDEFIQVTGYHRKAAIRLLHRYGLPRRGRRRGRQRQYGDETVNALRMLWEASDHLCSKRLTTFIGELIWVLRGHGELAVNADVEAEPYEPVNYRPSAETVATFGRISPINYH